MALRTLDYRVLPGYHCSPLQRQEGRAARFFAGLASIPDLASLAIRQRLELMDELTTVVPEARPVTEIVLRLAHKEARNRIVRLLEGDSVRTPIERRVSLRGRKIVARYEPLTGDRGPAFPELYQLLEPGLCPFGRCPQCENIFVQPGRGKPRRYCSDRCKAKGIPSASKRTFYARGYRRRRRQKETTIARRVIQASPKAAQFSQLRKALPRKKRGQIRWLLRVARLSRPPVRRGR
jgi:hypothetical protein